MRHAHAGRCPFRPWRVEPSSEYGRFRSENRHGTAAASRTDTGRTVVTSAIAVSVDLPSSSVRVGGELDRDTAHHLLEAVEMLTARSSRRWQLDAADVTFCDAGGLRALTDAQAFAAAHGRTLRVVRSSRPVDRLVELLEGDQPFPPLGPDGRRVRSGAPAGRRTQVRCGATGTA